MNKEHLKILQNNRKFLVENLTENAIDNICDQLLENGTLTQGLKETIQKKTPKPQAQTRELLTTLTKRGPKAYTSFIDALNETGNEFIAETLTSISPTTGAKNTSAEKPEELATPADIPIGAKRTSDKKPEELAKPAEWPNMSKGCGFEDGKNIKKTTNEIYREILKKHNPDKIYSMTNEKKGKIIFLCNTCKPTEVDEQTKCCLSSLDWDKTIMESLFKGTGYVKTAKQNITGEEMKAFLKGDMHSKENERYDSLILVICSGGIDFEPSKIYDKSGTEVPLNDILSIIRSSPAFKDKPKIVILQTYSFKDLKTSCDELDSQMEKLQLNNENTEDLFVVSSYPKTEYGPWMVGNKVKGSYFIQALAYVMKNHSCMMSFVEIITEVNRCLSNALVPEFEGGKETSNTTKRAVAEAFFVTKCSKREFFIFPGLDLTKTSSHGNPVCQSNS